MKYTVSSCRYVYFAEKGVKGVTAETLEELIAKLREEMGSGGGLEAGTEEAEQVFQHPGKQCCIRL